MTIAVLGGGISGLSVAYYLSKHVSPASILIFESSERTGGWIRSYKTNKEIIFEQAPRTLRPKAEAGINTLKLIEELGLSQEIIPILSSSSAARNRLIYSNGELHKLPTSLWSLFTKTSPFSKPLILAILKESRIPSKKTTDESIYDFIKRRLGTEIADYLISPLICGICAGNSKQISVHFLAGKLFEYEQEYGSITKGVIKNLLTKKVHKPSSTLIERAKREKWNIYSFKNGLETLPRKMNDHLLEEGVHLKLGSECEQIDFCEDGVLMHFQTETIKSKHLFCTILAEKLSQLVAHQHPDLSYLLQKIRSVNVAVVNLHFKGNQINNPGFGFLVPPKENIPILGVIYDSCCFDQKGDTVLTVMMGGYWFDKHFSDFSNDEQFYELAMHYIKKILKITENPMSYKISVLKKCIPQYTIGHMEKVKNIVNYLHMHNLPLSICGMSYYGVGVNDVISTARLSVENFLKQY